ncbi:MAG TPA: Clp protease N-terminal domain-containing protein, partial [Acidimicrobiales bacterium]|nr:Clp protease N-terminal domain-containing protein [Acidimicrobiales bacterium]
LGGGILRADAETSGGLFDRLGLGREFAEALDAEATSALGKRTRDAKHAKRPFDRGAKKALELSLRSALDLGQSWIGIGHMVLGLQRGGELNTLNEHLPVEAQGIVARWEADQQAPAEVDQRAALRWRLRAGRRSNPRSDGNVAQGFTQVIHAAHDLARGQVGSQHLLLGMFDAGDIAARRVLESLGITKAKVQEAVEFIGTAGTLDEPPQPEYEVRVGDHAIRVDHPESRDMLRKILDDDPDLAERIRAAIERRAKEAGK